MVYSCILQKSSICCDGHPRLHARPSPYVHFPPFHLHLGSPPPGPGLPVPLGAGDRRGPGDTAPAAPGELGALHVRRADAPEFIALHSAQCQSPAISPTSSTTGVSRGRLSRGPFAATASSGTRGPRSPCLGETSPCLRTSLGCRGLSQGRPAGYEERTRTRTAFRCSLPRPAWWRWGPVGASLSLSCEITDDNEHLLNP